MIRPAAPADTPALVALAEATGVFYPHEIDTLREVLDDYHETQRLLDHHVITFDSPGGPVGVAYYGPTAMTVRTWELWWIAVDPREQGRGIGGRLLEATEEDVRRRAGRLLLIQTSSLPRYLPTRGFYLKHDYRQVAQIPDFYADGDDQVVFAKRIAPPLA